MSGESWRHEPRTALARYSREVARGVCQGPDEALTGGLFLGGPRCDMTVLTHINNQNRW